MGREEGEEDCTPALRWLRFHRPILGLKKRDRGPVGRCSCCESVEGWVAEGRQGVFGHHDGANRPQFSEDANLSGFVQVVDAAGTAGKKARGDKQEPRKQKAQHHLLQFASVARILNKINTLGISLLNFQLDISQLPKYARFVSRFSFSPYGFLSALAKTVS